MEDDGELWDVIEASMRTARVLKLDKVVGPRRRSASSALFELSASSALFATAASSASSTSMLSASVAGSELRRVQPVMAFVLGAFLGTRTGRPSASKNARTTMSNLRR